MNQKIYRQEALDRLSSPDQFDQLMPLTNLRAWIALAGGGLLLVAATLWAIFGSITVTVDGEGVFTRPGGVRTVRAPASGRVLAVEAEVGKKVGPGATLLRLTGGTGKEGPARPLKIVNPLQVPARVLAISVDRGHFVEKGLALVTLEPLDADLEAVLFIPASEDAYLIKRGDTVRLTRGSGKGERDPVNGTVKSVSRYPADSETLRRVLQNEVWADQISRAGPCLQVVIELADGRDLPGLYSGAPCHAHIVVDRRRPISLVLPVFSSFVWPRAESR